MELKREKKVPYHRRQLPQGRTSHSVVIIRVRNSSSLFTFPLGVPLKKDPVETPSQTAKESNMSWLVEGIPPVLPCDHVPNAVSNFARAADLQP